MGRSYRELGYEAVSTRDEDATQSEVLIWSYEALDVDSSGYAMKVAGITPGGPFALWRNNSGCKERAAPQTLGMSGRDLLI